MSNKFKFFIAITIGLIILSASCLLNLNSVKAAEDKKITEVTEEEFNTDFCNFYAVKYLAECHNESRSSEDEQLALIDKYQNEFGHRYDFCIKFLENNSLYEAIKNKDYLFCSKSEDEFVEDKEVGWAPKSYVFLSACNAYFASEIEDYNICKSQKWSSLCVFWLALKENNISICNLNLIPSPLEDSTSIERCMYDYALYKTDLDACQKITDSFNKMIGENCVSDIVEGLSKREKDVSKCDLIKDKMSRDMCVVNFQKYISSIQRGETDINPCLNIQERIPRDECIGTVAINLKNISLCKKIEDPEGRGYYCERNIPFSFKRDQMNRVIFVLILPLLVVLLGAIIFIRPCSKKLKTRYGIFALVYLLYYIPWVCFISRTASYVWGEYTPIQAFRVGFGFIHGPVVSLVNSLFSGYSYVMLSILIYFAVNLSIFAVLFFYIVVVPGIKLRKVRNIILIITALEIILSIVSFFFGLMMLSG